MAELLGSRSSDVRKHLLTTVSTLVLVASGQGIAAAAQTDADRPILWVELGGDLEQVDAPQQLFHPHFLDVYPKGLFTPPLSLEGSQPWSFGGEGKITLQPEATDWSFSASILYGRSTGKKLLHQQTTPPVFTAKTFTTQRFYIQQKKFADTKVVNREEHVIVDFQAGKDVALGLFGRDSTSVVGAGVRFAQFGTKSKVNLAGDPDFHYSLKYLPQIHKSFPIAEQLHYYTASANIDRGFHGFGPSISWDNSAVLAGNWESGVLTFDWNTNAAVLFGRQKSQVEHQITSNFFKARIGHHYTPTHTHTVTAHTRSRAVTVPNIGGLAGISFRWPNAKISVGYRADLFFGAMDGGIDTAKKENRGFYGPFATISIGMGG
jgi:hypothetical protein